MSFRVPCYIFVTMIEINNTSEGKSEFFAKERSWIGRENSSKSTKRLLNMLLRHPSLALEKVLPIE